MNGSFGGYVRMISFFGIYALLIAAWHISWSIP